MPAINPFQRLAIRAALKIHEQLAGQVKQPRLDLPVQRWDELVRVTQKLRHAQLQGWRCASGVVLEYLSYSLSRLTTQLNIIRYDLVPPCNTAHLSTPGSLVADLQTLQSEFPQVSIDLRGKTITVQTAPIILEDEDFGPFDVVLHWDRIGKASAYEVIAQEPYRPNEHSEVTHPHVRSQELCEGEGKSAIASALSSGRLLDFFLLVRQILQTYNPGSAFVAIDSWQSVTCEACGYSMPEDEGGSCDRCSEALCSDCSTGCEDCNRSVCSDCATKCTGCSQWFCTECLEEVSGTTSLLCSACLETLGETNDEEECDDGDEGKESDGDDGDEVECDAEPAVHAVCLGEAVAVA